MILRRACSPNRESAGARTRACGSLARVAPDDRPGSRRRHHRDRGRAGRLRDGHRVGARRGSDGIPTASPGSCDSNARSFDTDQSGAAAFVRAGGAAGLTYQPPTFAGVSIARIAASGFASSSATWSGWPKQAQALALNFGAQDLDERVGVERSSRAARLSAMLELCGIGHQLSIGCMPDTSVGEFDFGYHARRVR